MEAEEPNLCVPLPSPQPTAELLESLDLTPERKQTTRSFLKRRRRPVAGIANNLALNDHRTSPTPKKWYVCISMMASSFVPRPHLEKLRRVRKGPAKHKATMVSRLYNR